MVSAAGGNLQNLGSALRSANAAAASQTTAIAAPAADEVSSAISAALGTHAQEFQALSARAERRHGRIPPQRADRKRRRDL
ncbi:PE family protein [Mycobacterium sp. 852002-50816_SCH5313054-b]|uniref:PE family protein n=1 Tax=Mycobacterium sp. 852002-50816_SCH5313054-b TaxID=1834092 RepID=UPI001E35632E|nr:PE family protein [Mycobacterium sp. 852002-50816_SCH5313054-b]